MMSTAERLEQVEKAISAIETTGQEYRIGSRLLRRGDLGTLYAERRSLAAQVAADEGYNVQVAVFDGR